MEGEKGKEKRHSQITESLHISTIQESLLVFVDLFLSSILSFCLCSYSPFISEMNTSISASFPAFLQPPPVLPLLPINVCLCVSASVIMPLITAAFFKELFTILPPDIFLLSVNSYSHQLVLVWIQIEQMHKNDILAFRGHSDCC